MFSMAHSVLVFPCRQDKSPATKHGFKDASSDPAVIRKMFARACRVHCDADRQHNWGIGPKKNTWKRRPSLEKVEKGLFDRVLNL